MILMIAQPFSTVASFPILLLEYSALARYRGYWSLLNSSDHAGCLKSVIRIILEWTEMWHWRNNQCYILWEPQMRKVQTTLVFDPTVEAVLSHYWTDALADAAAVSPVAQRWRGTRSPGQRPGRIPRPTHWKALWARVEPLALGLMSPLRDPAHLTKSHC